MQELIHDPGYYFAVLPTLESKNKILAWGKENPQVKLVDDFHITVLYSRKTIWCKPVDGINIVNPHGFEVFDGNYFVLKFIAPSLVVRHQYLIDNGGTHDFPTYMPHMTLSIGHEVDINKLTPFTSQLIFDKEYKNRLN